jgi:hypothetical protein
MQAAAARGWPATAWTLEFARGTGGGRAGPPEGAVQVRAVAQAHPDGHPLGEAPGRELAQGQALVHRHRPFHPKGDHPGLRQNRRVLRAAAMIASLVSSRCRSSTASAEPAPGPEAYCNPQPGLTWRGRLLGRPRPAGRQARAGRQEGRQGRLPPCMSGLHRTSKGGRASSPNQASCQGGTSSSWTRSTRGAGRGCSA